MVTNNETRNREAQFSRNCIMEKSCVRYFKLLFVFCLRGIHFDMVSEKTNSARYGSQAREIIKRLQRRKERREAVITIM